MNPKNVTVGDIMRFYESDKPFPHNPSVSPNPRTYWTDEDDNKIPNGTCCVLIGYMWIDTQDYVGYEFELLLPNGVITKGWGEYAVEPVWSQKKSRRKWYKPMSEFF